MDERLLDDLQQKQQCDGTSSTLEVKCSFKNTKRQITDIVFKAVDWWIHCLFMVLCSIPKRQLARSHSCPSDDEPFRFKWPNDLSSSATLPQCPSVLFSRTQCNSIQEHVQQPAGSAQCLLQTSEPEHVPERLSRESGQNRLGGFQATASLLWD